MPMQLGPGNLSTEETKVCSSLEAGRSCENVPMWGKRVSLQPRIEAGKLRPLSGCHRSALPRASWSALPGSPLQGALVPHFTSRPDPISRSVSTHLLIFFL